jgi:hypothetical protein
MDERASATAVREARYEIKGSVHFISSLSPIDGLLWLRRDLTLLGFGVIIKTVNEPERVVRARNDASGTRTTNLDLNSLGT